jgi:hypothetical protein
MTSNVVLKKLGLDSAELIDAMFAIALTLLGLVGFRYAFGQHQYMVVGTVAALVGALVALVIIRFKLPGLVALALSAVVFLIVGAAVAINDQTIAGFLPTPSGFTGLVDGIMSGWRKLLTTLPPSGSLGNLLAVPFLCGYVSALSSTLLARRSKLLGTLLVWPGLVVALSVLFGDRKPFSLIVQGAVFGTVTIGWLATNCDDPLGRPQAHARRPRHAGVDRGFIARCRSATPVCESPPSLCIRSTQPTV